MLRNLRKLRKELGMSQQELAEKAGLSQQAIHYYEVSEREPKVGDAAAIADALGVTLPELLGLPADAPPEALTPDERELLALWRSMADAGREALMASARGLAEAFPQGEAQGPGGRQALTA